jgi:NAD-dependent dihydropyrimidine dehydrogenase PreA subunit
MANHLAVILSQGPSNHPAKRQLEAAIVAELASDPRLDVLVVPHLYDLPPNSPALTAVRDLSHDLIVVSWLYPRAAHWTLDRHNVRGRLGTAPPAVNRQSPQSEPDASESSPVASVPRVIDQRPLPTRSIYHLDLRMSSDPRVWIDAVKRITAALMPPPADKGSTPPGARPLACSSPAHDVLEAPVRRWYPVIDYSRCTNCMECIDFCLFGVYGVDHLEMILVEQPDHCRKGCPACSRVCPENAIMFPHHKTPAIAGDPRSGGGTKLNLSQLFGKPTDVETAAREREDHLRQTARERSPRPGDADPIDTATRAPAAHDELDDLLDELDQMDL